jgi:hypothetical protein
MATIEERYADKIQGTLGCYDRIILQGYLPSIGYADAMTRYLQEQGIRIFDYPKFAQALRDEIRVNAERVARKAGLSIQFVRKLKGVRKEELVRKHLAKRGDAPGLVCILSAMESCSSYKPWHDKATGKTFLKSDVAKCLHYYFYFIDSELGLCHLRVPTWCPFRLQFYFNGHNWLASKLRKAGIAYQMRDNAFLSIADYQAAQALSDDFSVAALRTKLARYVRQLCPAATTLGGIYDWSIMQVEYSTDLILRRQQDLAPLYQHLVRTAVHAVKAEDVATFLGRKLSPAYQGELGNDFSKRILGTRIKHSMGPASLKMYDKCGLVLRIETTANDVSFFKQHRTVYHRDGARSFQLARLPKSIDSLAPALHPLLAASNRRYLDFLSQLDDPSPSLQALDKVTASVKLGERTYRGFNFFSPEDRALFTVLLRGEFNISGLRNRDLRRHLPTLSSSQVSHRIKRLRLHGLLKKVGGSYKYYLTALGRRVFTAALRLREFVILPSLSHPAPS